MITTTFLGHFITSNGTQCNTTLLDNSVLINTNYKPVGPILEYVSKLIKNLGEIQAMISDWMEKYTHTQQQHDSQLIVKTVNLLIVLIGIRQFSRISGDLQT